MDKKKDTGLVVLKETAEPEEEEDTLDDVRNLRLSNQQLELQNEDDLSRDEDANALEL